ncbi:response regulator transcription factor [Candidatus Enterococcus ikei]|uniref:DNA-binding response regulator n=1 Tax=Candidatus Enterococcus ikei TaxID=2815326 RepID=A0ABS3GVX7_9ENTE|nr:DNA-binding response regulator [Enterococcus sp. DIV0869a]MBO0439387.1 DNA-binding response regulator [Enterococcus sp. DIV0869a]
MKNIMIVEEDELERKFIKEIIKENYQRENLNVVEVQNGTEALKKARVFQPELVVMDIEVAGVNGLELQKEMLQIKPTIYTIWTSIYSNFDLLSQGLTYNIRGYLLKPYTKKQIMQHLDKFMTRKKKYTLSESYNKQFSEGINKAIQFIKKNFKQKTTIDDIANHVYLNPQYFGRLFRKELGISVNDYVNLLKIEESCRLLHETDLPLYRIATEVGFADSSYFTRVFTKHMKMTPHEYRKREAIK